VSLSVSVAMRWIVTAAPPHWKGTLLAGVTERRLDRSGPAR
jgi:hypothetical protein